MFGKVHRKGREGPMDLVGSELRMNPAVNFAKKREPGSSLAFWFVSIRVDSRYGLDGDPRQLPAVAAPNSNYVAFSTGHSYLFLSVVPV